MQIGEYFWVRRKQGDEWFIGLIYGDEIEFVGTTHASSVADFAIGPKVIGHDAPLISRSYAVEEILSAVTLRDMRDRFAVAALAAHVGDFQVVYATTMMDALAEKCYAIADAMLAERARLKS